MQTTHLRGLAVPGVRRCAEEVFVPRRGIYHGIEGLAAAQPVPGVICVTITVEPGQIIAPPPDGASQLGFVFARAASPVEAEYALRIAHRRLYFDIRSEYPAKVAPAAEWS